MTLLENPISDQKKEPRPLRIFSPKFSLIKDEGELKGEGDVLATEVKDGLRGVDVEGSFPGLPPGALEFIDCQTSIMTLGEQFVFILISKSSRILFNTNINVT